MSWRRCFLLVAWIQFFGLLVPAAARPPWSPEQEARVGRRAAEKVEHIFKLYHDQKAQERVESIVAKLAEHQRPSQRRFSVKPVRHPPVKFTVKLLDTEMVNAMALPGGYIYVTRGLLETVESDDELAGVLAHEMAHTLLYHALDQAKKNKKAFVGTLAAAAAAVLLGARIGDAATVFYGAQYVRMGLLSGYSIEDETEADELGLLIVNESPYNPVGLLTLMEKLSRETRLQPKPELGIFQTHPYPDERLRNIRAKLERLDVDINRLSVTYWERAEALDCFDGGELQAQLWLWGQPLLTAAASSPEGAAPLARLQAAADQLNAALRAGLRGYEVRVEEDHGIPVVVARNRRLLKVYPQDADAVGLAPDEAAQAAVRRLRQAFALRELQRTYGSG